MRYPFALQSSSPYRLHILGRLTDLDERRYQQAALIISVFSLLGPKTVFQKGALLLPLLDIRFLEGVLGLA